MPLTPLAVQSRVFFWFWGWELRVLGTAWVLGVVERLVYRRIGAGVPNFEIFQLHRFFNAVAHYARVARSKGLGLQVYYTCWAYWVWTMGSFYRIKVV